VTLERVITALAQAVIATAAAIVVAMLAILIPSYRSGKKRW
jgi:biopolymer transport protein ExbB/TolQ